MVYIKINLAYHSITLHCTPLFLYEILNANNFFIGEIYLNINKKCKNAFLHLSVNDDDDDCLQIIEDNLFLSISSDTYSLFQYSSDCIKKYGLPFSTELNDLTLLPKNKTLSFIISVAD